MKPLLLTLLIATLCATGYGQTLKSVMYNTTNNTVVGLSNAQRLNFEHIGLTSGTATAPSLTYASGTNTFGTFASSGVGIGPFLGFSVDGERRFFISTNTIRAELPLSFNNATNGAVTRTNLGIPLPAITETSNVLMMRALSGSTNTNEPFSGSVVVDTNTLVFTNGILLEVTTP
jgi:hypothetical protein